MIVRVRFAPSPTGYLHVGGLRTALYNYLFARHHGGKMILRIEDTDRTRLVEGAQENLIKSLEWAGINFDEGPHIGGDFGPYIQSERFDLYKKYGMELIESGHAYYAFDTPEEIDAMREKQKSTGDFKYQRDLMKNSLNLTTEETKKQIEEGHPYVIRMKVPHEQEIVFQDIIRGEVKVIGKEVDDQVLLKSDGFPTYHLANVVDDHLMQITHVIRGEEWLPSTPKHTLLYRAFGWDVPEFAHLPLLLNKDKSKLSKRQGDVAVEDYVAKGFFKDAFINFIALLGWNPTGDREIYSFDELIEFFNLEKVNKAGAVFDLEKLTWVNAQYLRTKSMDELADYIIPYLESQNQNYINRDFLKQVIDLFKERIENMLDLYETTNYMFAKPTEFDLEALKKNWKEETTEIMPKYLEFLKTQSDWTHSPLYEATKIFCEEQNFKIKFIVNPLRIMITGSSKGAGMFETMELLGKKECIDRIEYFWANISLK
ncbi:MAG: glutamate--tRNA ligase [Ignavibacteria bacterium GWF2_33_9]|nr:MAG: glutamate--tRNA ligase [Ignavibacteria bacterium GWF2_33_9]